MIHLAVSPWSDLTLAEQRSRSAGIWINLAVIPGDP